MEENLLKLIATDRIEIPFSSLEQKLRRDKVNIAKDISLGLSGTGYTGNRTFAYTAEEEKERARGMKEAINEFVHEFPKYGEILKGKITEKRMKCEKHLYFGMNDGCKLTSGDYMEVMTNLGISERVAEELYPNLMGISRKLEKIRCEERSIIVGSYE